MKVLLKTNIGKHDVCLTVKCLFVRKLCTCLTAYIVCTFCWCEANEIWSGIDYFLSLPFVSRVYMCNVVFDSKTVKNKVRLLRCCRAGQISLPPSHRMSLSRQVRLPLPPNSYRVFRSEIRSNHEKIDRINYFENNVHSNSFYSCGGKRYRIRTSSNKTRVIDYSVK